MRSAASRLHKGFSFAKRFQGCSDWICCDGAAWAGRWDAWAPGGTVRGKAFSHVVLDLGCGKGEYTVACAKLRPDVLFVGFDVDAVCTLRAAEAASAVGVDNAVFLMDGVPSFEEHPEQAHASRASEGRVARSGAPAEIDLSTVFAVGELSALLMNFPTPFPKKKKAHLRLTYLDRLMGYRPLLGRGAGIRLRTDSQPLRDFPSRSLSLRATKSRGEAMTSAPSSPTSLGAPMSASSPSRAPARSALQHAPDPRPSTWSKQRRSRLSAICPTTSIGSITFRTACRAALRTCATATPASAPAASRSSARR